jgi:hypothetical protein
MDDLYGNMNKDRRAGKHFGTRNQHVPMPSEQDAPSREARALDVKTKKEFVRAG